jgi:hypothetical protein
MTAELMVLLVLQMAVMVAVVVAVVVTVGNCVVAVDIRAVTVSVVPVVYARAMGVAVTEVQADGKTAFRERGRRQCQKKNNCSEGQ